MSPQISIGTSRDYTQSPLFSNGTLSHTAAAGGDTDKQIGEANLVGACDDGASSPLMSRLFRRRNVLSLAGVDADAAAAAPGAAPLPPPSGACCSLRLDGEPALPPLVDAEYAAPAETGGVPRAARAPTGGGGRWAPPSPSGLSATPETMATRRPRRIGGAELGRRERAGAPSWRNPKAARRRRRRRGQNGGRDGNRRESGQTRDPKMFSGFLLACAVCFAFLPFSSRWLFWRFRVRDDGWRLATAVDYHLRDARGYRPRTQEHPTDSPD
jgi:hypothetical protein